MSQNKRFKSKRSFPKLYQLGLKYPGTVLFLAVVSIFLSLLQIGKLELLTDLAALLPKNTESVAHLAEYKERFGGLGYLVVGVEADDPAASEQFAEQFAGLLEKTPSVKYVEYRFPVDFFSKRLWLFLEPEDLKEVERRVERARELQAKGVSPAFSHLMDFADEDDRADLTFEDIRKKYEAKFGDFKNEGGKGERPLRLIWVKPKISDNDIAENRHFLGEVRDLERQLRAQGTYGQIQVGYTGDYATSIEEVDFLSRETAWVSCVVTFLLFAVVVLYFRRWSSVFLIGLPLLAGIAWTGGLVYLILGHLNLITAFAAAILAGLGSDYGIYLLTRFLQERKQGRDFENACRLAFGSTGRATFGSMITTVAAFGALLFSNFGVFVEFGIVGGLGLLMNYVGMMLLMPALLTLAERYRSLPANSRLRSWDEVGLRGLPSASHWFGKIFSPRYAFAGLLAFLLLLGGAALTISPQVKIYFEEGQMDTASLPGNLLYARVSEILGETLRPTVLLVDSPEEERKVVESFSRQIDSAAPNELVFNRVLGMASLQPQNQNNIQTKLAKLAESYQSLRFLNPGKKEEILESLRESIANSPFTEADLPPEVQRRFKSESKESLRAVYVYPAISRVSSDNIETYYRGLEKGLEQTGVKVRTVDSSFIQRDILSLIEREAPRGFALILVFFAGFLFLTLRPFRSALWVLLNLLASLVLLSGVLYLAKIPLNVLNIAVIPIVLGTGIDCFIHFSHRYEEEGEMEPILHSELPPIFVSSLTSILGFGGLVLTSSLGLRSVGWVSVLGLSVVTLVCALIFPRCLVFFSGTFKWQPALKEKAVEPL